MNKRSHNGVAFIAGFALAFFVATTILVAAVLLIVRVTVNVAVVPVSAVLAVGTTAVFCRGYSRCEFMVGIALAIGAVLVAVLAASSVFDISYDGNSYHKAAIGALAYGWNPVYESITDYWARADFDLSPVTHALWADHYAKGSWLFGASIYVLTGTIESAKSINLIMSASTGLVVFDWLRRRWLHTTPAAIVSIFAAVTPVSFPLMFTNYVDGLLASVITEIVVVLLELSELRVETRGTIEAHEAAWTYEAVSEAQKTLVSECRLGMRQSSSKGESCLPADLQTVNRVLLDRYPKTIAFDEPKGKGADAVPLRMLWWLLAAAILICVNVKFTGFVYAAFFCAAFYFVWLVRAWRKGKGPELIRCFVRLTGYYLLVVVVSAGIAGSNTYVTNALDHGSPFYPLISEQTADVIDAYQPDSFQTMNPYKKFVLGLFSVTQNAWKESVRLKVPFTFDSSELAVDTYDTRRAGFGAFFSGIFLVSLAACVACGVRLWCCGKDGRRLLVDLLAIVATCVVLVGATDGSWWARYTPYLWFCPLVALAYLLHDCEYGAQTGESGWPLFKHLRRVFGFCFAVIMAVDIATFWPVFANGIESMAEANVFIAELCEADDDGPVTVSLSDSALGGSLYNLLDAGVDYRYTTWLDGSDVVFELDVVGLRAMTSGSSLAQVEGEE